MRNSVCLPVFAAVLAAPIGVGAAPALTALMKQWRNDARALHAMVTGRASFDSTTVEAALNRYVNDAERLQSEISGRSADAKDLKRRFVAFRSDSQAALGHIGDRSALGASVSQLLSDCKSCHDLYNK